MNILNELQKLKDEKYADFQAKLIPNINRKNIFGVRVPVLRNFAKKYAGSYECREFLTTFPHKFYDENMLHAILISQIKDYDTCILMLNKFLPYVDNWAVCDILNIKSINNKNDFFNKVITWINSKETYTCRFGIKMLMTYFLEEDDKSDYLMIPLKVKNNDYYVKMMIAWFYATALNKKWDDTIKVFEQKKLDKWTFNKTIQKAVESYRITKEQKDYLRKLKKDGVGIFNE